MTAECPSREEHPEHDWLLLGFPEIARGVVDRRNVVAVGRVV
jgi:hypothetical protein